VKSVSANTALIIDSPDPAPILLFEIAFTSPSNLTLYLCSRPFFPRNTFDGHVYDPLINGWSPIRLGEIDPIRYATRPGEMSLHIDNNTPIGGHAKFSELLGAYDAAYATVLISQIHEGATAPDDEVDVFKGQIEAPEKMDRSQVSLRISDIALGHVNKWPYIIVTTDDYSGADPDDVGKMLPQVWGECKRVPFAAVDAGVLTTIGEDLDASETTVTIGDAAKFALLPASGTIQIDEEQITYTAKGENELTGCTRGANATTATAHNLGAAVFEVQSEYFYIMGHAVKSIDAVYIRAPNGEWVRQEGGYTAYTGQSGNEHASYPGKACLKFTVKPVIQHETNQDVDEGSHGHTGSQTIGAWKFDYTSDEGGFPTNMNNVIDGDYDTSSPLDENDQIGLHKGEYEDHPGPPENLRLVLVCKNIVGTVKFSFLTEELSVTDANDDSTVRSSWAEVAASEDTWEEWNAAMGLLEVVGSSLNNQIAEAWVEFKYTPTINSGPASGVALTGNSVADTVIGTAVACDVSGYRDDGSGTYTGTPNALIERPDHVFKHWLKVMLGLSDSEIDSASYNASGSAYSSNSFELTICLTEPPKVLDLMAEAARQCRSLQFWEAGVHHLKYLEATPSVDETLSGHRIDLNQVWLDHTLRTDIRNDFTATFNKYWSGYSQDVDSERSIVDASAAASIAKYGHLRMALSFPYIGASAMATVILEWIRDDLDEPRLLINLIGDVSFLKIERGDVVSFDVDESQLNDALLGLVLAASKFRVLDKKYLPNFKEQIKMVAC